MRYAGHADVAQVAALLDLCGLVVDGTECICETTGDTVYRLRDSDGRLWTTTARELSYMATRTMEWFHYPYGDRGEQEERDEKGKIVKEGRQGKPGYVNPAWRDAMQLPQEEFTVNVRRRFRRSSTMVFSLPQVACSNLTWEQYRSLQSIAPLLFREGIGEDELLSYQAQFLAHIVVPEQPEQPTVDRFRPSHVFKYESSRAEQSIAFWIQQLPQHPTLFHICFQVYQTAVLYYETVYPLLFHGEDNKKDVLRDALTGEVGTVNTVMKYAGYATQQEVYDSNLPFVLDILNTMTKEAKEIEKIHAKAKK